MTDIDRDERILLGLWLLVIWYVFVIVMLIALLVAAVKETYR